MLADFHLFMENPPSDQTERWSNRPFRSLSVVLPPASVNLHASRTEKEKKRFLENLWQTQAKYRSKLGQSIVLRSQEREVESRGGRTTFARTYYNVYQRTDFMKEARKVNLLCLICVRPIAYAHPQTKVVVHIDALASSDPIPFGLNGNPPYVSIRVQPMAGELCRYTVTSNQPDESDQDIVQTGRVPDRIVQTSTYTFQKKFVSPGT